MGEGSINGNMNHINAIDTSVLSRDPHVIQDILDGVEEQYYSITFDSGKYEIESLAGPSCRELSQLKLRLLFLDKQNKAVSRRVSELVLEKHPLYEAELNGVLSLQVDNWETLALCRRIRSSLKMSDHALVNSRLVVLRNFRRSIHLRRVLCILREIRALQNNVHLLDTLLNERNFHAAIELHRKSLVLHEYYRQYRCIEPIHVKLQAFGMRIEDLLDSELQLSCDHFTEQSYTTVQQAFELLGSTQTTFAQLQMHYLSTIQRRALTVVQSFVTQTDEDTDSTFSMPDYAQLCLRLPLHSLHICLQRVCQSLWLTLLCYHQTILWHQSRARGKRMQQSACQPRHDCLNNSSRRIKSSERNSGSISPNPTCNHAERGCSKDDARQNLCTVDSEEDLRSATVRDDLIEDTEHATRSQMFRQWHDYVASKLLASRSRIWTEVSGRIEAIVKCVGQLASDMHFDQIASVLKTVNHMVAIGEEFCGSLSTDLLEVLRISIYKFFRDFHRKHMERLKMFLENETWESCPVKPTFTILELQEYRALIDMLRSSESQKENKGISSNETQSSSSNVHSSASGHKRLFDPPYMEKQFPVSDVPSTLDVRTNGCESEEFTGPSSARSLVERAKQIIDSPLTQRLVSSSPDETLTTRQKSPLLSNTTLEVLRLIGRYLQMMNLLQPIAGEVMHSICQMFDYYLYSIFMFFGPTHLMDSTELPERLRLTLKRVGERLIAEQDHPSVLKGNRMCVHTPVQTNDPNELPHDRFALPDHKHVHILNTIGQVQDTDSTENYKTSSTLWVAFLQAHLVGVESVIYLADILEQVLLPYLSACIPERKRGITLVFREQSLLAARQLREPCAVQTIPILINLMLPSESSSQKYGTATTGVNALSGLGKLWPLTAAARNSLNTPNKSDDASTQSSNTSSVTDAVESNPLAALVCAINWINKQVATVPNNYVNLINSRVLLPFASGLQTTTQRLRLSEANRSMLWSKLLACIADYLLDAYSQVHACSEDGRGQMLLDVQSIAVMAESIYRIKPFPRLDCVIEYIQAFYIPVHEWEHWLTQTRMKFSKSQLIGLAHCLARGDRRLRQRLLNTVNQVCAANVTATQVSSLTILGTHSSSS